MEQFQTELDLITLKNDVLGESFNRGRAQLTYFKQTLEKLWDAGKRPGDSVLDQIVMQVKELTKQQYALDLMTGAFTEFFSITTEGFKNFGDFIKGWISSVLRSFQQLIAQLLAKKLAMAILGLFSGGAAAGAAGLAGISASGGAAGAAASSFGLFFGHAQGTNNAPGGLSLVGERGPELLNLPRGAGVFSNSLIGAALRGGQSERVVFEIKEDRLQGILRKGSKRNSLV